MAEDKVSAIVSVNVIVEVRVGVWGGEARFDQLHKQATGEAVRKLENHFAKDHDIRVLKADASSVTTQVRP